MRNILISLFFVIFPFVFSHGQGIDSEVGKNINAQFNYRDSINMLERLDRVSYALLRSGVPFCFGYKHRVGIGMYPQSLNRYKGPSYDVLKNSGMGKDWIYPYVINNSPLEKAGLQPGDVFVKINQDSIPDSNEVDSIAWMSDKINTLSSGAKGVDVVVSRNSKELTLNVNGLAECALDIRFSTSRALYSFGAFVKGRSVIYVSAGLIDQLKGDDELALIIAHELAHSILRHTEELAGKSKLHNAIGLLGLLAGRAILPGDYHPSLEQEKDAEYLSLYLMALAGFNVAKAKDVDSHWAEQMDGAKYAIESQTEKSWRRHYSWSGRSAMVEKEARNVVDKMRDGGVLRIDSGQFKTFYSGDFIEQEGGKKVIKMASKKWTDGDSFELYANVHPVSKYAASGFAEVADISMVPLTNSEACRKRYEEWLLQKTPRAFAVGLIKGCGFSWGTQPKTPGDSEIPAERVIAACERVTGNGNCVLYAVDDRVVYKKPD